MNYLYLVRHGENWANITKEFSHRRVDYSLTPKGVLQAQQTAERLAGMGIHELYSSPLKRAQETAAIIGERLGLPVTILEELREVNVGDLEGQPPTREAWAYYISVCEEWLAGRHDVAFPGGEDYRGLWGRMEEALRGILAGKDGRRIALVGHGGIFTFTLKDLCPEVEIERLRTSSPGNGSIAELEACLRDGRLEGRLVAWPSHAHLHGEAADLISGLP